MAGKWRTVLRISGFIFLIGGAFAGLTGPWPWVLMVLGLGQIVLAGGFG